MNTPTLSPLPQIPAPGAEPDYAADARRFRFLLTLPASHAQAFFWNHKGKRNIRAALDAMQRKEIDEFNAEVMRRQAAEAAVRG